MNTGDSAAAQLDAWQETFDAISDIIMVISSEHKILRVNRVFRHFFGLTSEEIIGHHCYKLVHGLDEPIEGCPCAKALISTIHETGEIVDRGRDYAVTASPLFEDGKLTAFVHTIKDITDLKEQERLKAVLETAGSVCHHLTQPMQVVSANINLITAEADNIPEEVRARLYTILDNVVKMGQLMGQFQNIRLSPTMSYDENNNILDIDKASAPEVERRSSSR